MKKDIQSLKLSSQIRLTQQMMNMVKGGGGQPQTSKTRPLTGMY